MSYVPIIPSGGITGWSYLKRTLTTQKATFENDTRQQADMAYFREKIGQITTAEELVSDRRLLGVALTAFGLEGDLKNKAFIRRVLEDGTIKPGALANRLADKRYYDLSKAFGFGDFSVPNTKKSDFPAIVLTRFQTRRFEAAVGVANGDIRLALNAERELAELSRKTLSENGKWYTIMGSPPLRSFFQTALAIPGSVGALDIDRQLGIFKDRSRQLLGKSDPAQFADSSKIEAVVRQFLIRGDLENGSVAQSPLLSLFQGSSNGPVLSRYV